MNTEKPPVPEETTKQIAEMNRHIEKLIELKALEVVIQCALNDRNALVDSSRPIAIVQSAEEYRSLWGKAHRFFT